MREKNEGKALPSDYRRVLQDCMVKRISLNPKYSLRAFARDIGVSPGQLSSVLNRKRGISPKKAARVFEFLNLSTEERKALLLQVAQEHARSPKEKERARLSLKNKKNEKSLILTHATFEVISNCYHFAILNSLSLRLFPRKSTVSQQVEWVANHLSLQKIQVKSSLDALCELGLVKKGTSGYSARYSTIFTSDGVPSSALREFHRQILQKATAALEKQTLAQRYPNSILLPILSTSFPKMRDEILAFQNKILKKYGRVVQQDGDVVYALTQQLFKISGEI